LLAVDHTHKFLQVIIYFVKFFTTNYLFIFICFFQREAAGYVADISYCCLEIAVQKMHLKKSRQACVSLKTTELA